MTDRNSTPQTSTRGAPARRPKHTAPTSRTFAMAAGAAISALAISALYNRQRAKQAERDNPPTGKFVEVGGVASALCGARARRAARAAARKRQHDPGFRIERSPLHGGEEIPESSRSTGRASVTASAHAPRFGHLRRKQT